MKAQLEEIVRKELNLPDNAVIIKSSFQITNENEEIKVFDAMVLYEQKDGLTPEDVLVGGDNTIHPSPRTKYTRKAKKDAEPKTPALRRAQEGEGKNITEAQIKGWRITLGVRQKMGQLTKEQISALEATKGKHAGKLEPEQKQQIKDIFDETTPARF